MTEHLELREATELYRAEARWLDQCAARLRRAQEGPTARPGRSEAGAPEMAR